MLCFLKSCDICLFHQEDTAAKCKIGAVPSIRVVFRSRDISVLIPALLITNPVTSGTLHNLPQP